MRPWFLVAAMVVTWLVGVQGTTAGCGTVLFLREGSLPDTTAALAAAREASVPDKVFEYVNAMQLEAIGVFSKRTLPLGIARCILSALLVMASAFVLSGRKNAKSLALQVLGANAAFGVLQYLLTQDVREHWINAVERSGLGDSHQEMWLKSSFWYWTSRIQFALFEVGIPALATLALLSKRTQVFLAAAAEAATQQEREDEP